MFRIMPTKSLLFSTPDLQDAGKIPSSLLSRTSLRRLNARRFHDGYDDGKRRGKPLSALSLFLCSHSLSCKDRARQWLDENVHAEDGGN